jgi:hypothetical protein
VAHQVSELPKKPAFVSEDATDFTLEHGRSWGTLAELLPDTAPHSVPAGGQPWPGETFTRGVELEISGSTSFPLLQALFGVLGA